MEIRNRKIRLRREMREAVASAFDGDPERRHTDEDKIVCELDRIIRSLRIRRPNGIWAFWPSLPEEPDFRGWLTGLMSSGMKIGLPRLNWEDRTLKFREVIDPEWDLEIDEKGLAQPWDELPKLWSGKVEAILVPGLAFDRKGGRLGRGAGFYDRTLAKVPKKVLLIGVCFDMQIVDEVPQDSWDRKVNAILSPGSGFRECSVDLASQEASI